MKKLPLKARIIYTFVVVITLPIAWLVITSNGTNITIIDYIAPPIIFAVAMLATWILDLV